MFHPTHPALPLSRVRQTGHPITFRRFRPIHTHQYQPPTIASNRSRDLSTCTHRHWVSITCGNGRLSRSAAHDANLTLRPRAGAGARAQELLEWARSGPNRILRTSVPRIAQCLLSRCNETRPLSRSREFRCLPDGRCSGRPKPYECWHRQDGGAGHRSGTLAARPTVLPDNNRWAHFTRV